MNPARYILLLLLFVLCASPAPAQPTGTIHVQKKNILPFSGLFKSDSYTLPRWGKGQYMGQSDSLRDYFYFFPDSIAVRMLRKTAAPEKQVRKSMQAGDRSLDVRDVFYEIKDDSVYIYNLDKIAPDDDTSAVPIPQMIYRGVIKNGQLFFIVEGCPGPLLFTPCRKAKNKLLDQKEK